MKPSTKFPTPPTWLRHVTPWWLLHLIDRHFGVCWANVVSWKVYGNWTYTGWNLPPECLDNTDYCGKFRKPWDDV